MGLKLLCLAACRRFPVVIVLNQGAWGKSQLGDWLPQKRIETREKCIAHLQTILQGKLKSAAEWAGLPSLIFKDALQRIKSHNKKVKLNLELNKGSKTRHT